MSIWKQLRVVLLCALAGVTLIGIVCVVVVTASGRELIVRWEPGRWTFRREEIGIAGVWTTRVGNLEIEKTPIEETFVFGPLEVGTRRWVTYRIVRTGK